MAKTLPKLSHENATVALLYNLTTLNKDGAVTPSRNGEMKEMTFNSFGVRNIRDRYINLEGRNVSLPAQIAETMWVLAGRNDVEFLQNYLPKAGLFSDDGVVWRGGYGPRIRNWDGVDQLDSVIKLLNKDPYTRRAVINIFNPAVDHQDSKDIPCNNWLHFLYRDGKLDLHVATRSNDIIWGWSGINNFEWSMLLEVVAHFTKMEPGEIHYSISSLHLYETHYKKAQKIIDANGSLFTYKLKTFTDNARYTDIPFGASLEDLEDFDEILGEWFFMEDRIRNGKATVEQLKHDISFFREPLLQAYLKVLLAWWSGRRSLYFGELSSTPMQKCLETSPEPVNPPKEFKKSPQMVPLGYTPFGVVAEGENTPEVRAVPTNKQDGLDAKFLVVDEFDASQINLSPEKQPTDKVGTVGDPDPKKFERLSDYIVALHTAKDAAYGNSWRKRGEMLGIMANLARKVDRLGKNGGGDTSLDTAIDLFVYSVKYRAYLDLARHEWSTPKSKLTLERFSYSITGDPALSSSRKLDDVQTTNSLIRAYFMDDGRFHEGEFSSRTHLSEYEEGLRYAFHILERIVVDEENVGVSKSDAVRVMIHLSRELATREWKKMKWHEGNATRRFDGYGKED